MSALAAGLAGVLVVGVGIGVWPGSSARPLTPGDTATTAPQGVAPARRPTLRRRWPQREAAGAHPAEVAEWCDGLARAVRSGSTLVRALDDTEPTAGVRDVVDQIRFALARGEPLEQALVGNHANPDVTIALTVLRACARNGGSPAQPLDRAAATLRERAHDQAERASHSAQAEMSAKVMTWLPVAMLTLLVATSASTRGALASPLGVIVVVAGAALNLVGWRWMRRVIRSRG